MAIDLSITSINIDSSWTTTFTGGGEINIEIEVANNGDETASNTRTHYYISDDNILDINDTFIGEDYLSSINAGSSRTDNFYIYPSNNVIQGEYYIFAIVDGDNRIAESDEMNNASSGVEFTINNNPALYGDLQLDSVVYDYSNYESTGEIGYTINYTNVGGAAIEGHGGIRAGDGTIGSNNSDSESIESVDPGESGSITGTLYTYDNFEGETFYLKAYLYGENEQNTSNNEDAPVQYVDQGSVNDPYDQGTFTGWYYQVETVAIETETVALGWYNGSHLEYGWGIGWNLGWYFDGSAWLYGWNVGWYFGWYNDFGWYYGWGEVTYTTYHSQLGDLMYAEGRMNGGWGWGGATYYGWANTGLGAGIGQGNNYGRIAKGPELSPGKLTGTGWGWHYDYGWSMGWNMGWYFDGSAWSVGWNMGWYLGWYADLGAFATFESLPYSEWLGGVGGFGWAS
ncbi:MAG: CARDB domain-containing protein [Pseudomonadota bacterium]